MAQTRERATLDGHENEKEELCALGRDCGL